MVAFREMFVDALDPCASASFLSGRWFSDFPPAQYAASEGIPIYTVGLGMGIDEGMLRMIADTSGGRFSKVTDPMILPQVFAAQVDHLLQK